jgi:proteasome alpha subunit
MPFYASPEQVMRDRSEYARKGISRGRSAIVLSNTEGVLFVSENLTSLRKVSEIYDKIGFAAVGRYNEFENLRAAGVRMADLRGYSYDRRDVNARALANAYAQTLGAIFTDQQKPFEVEICVAEVRGSVAEDELYRITYDGSVSDEHGFVAMGGQSEAIANVVKQGYHDDIALGPSLALAVKALGSVGGDGGAPRELTSKQLEVAVLDRNKPGRVFRRITGAALDALLATVKPSEPEPEPEPQTPATEAKPSTGTEAKPSTGTEAKPSTGTEAKPAAGPKPAGEAKPSTATEAKPPAAGEAVVGEPDAADTTDTPPPPATKPKKANGNGNGPKPTGE